MAKKKSDSTSLIKKGITLVASVVTFIFFFLEMLAIRSKGSLLGFEKDSKEGVKVFDLLFSEDYESLRENLSTTNIILWIVFILAIVAIVAAILAFVMKQGAMLSKASGVLLVLAMALLFVVNIDKGEFDALGLGIAKAETWVTNITALYFVSLGISCVGLGSALTLKK